MSADPILATYRSRRPVNTRPAPQMMLVPTPDVQRPRLLIIGCYLTGGRLFRCSECGAEVWSNFGHAKRHDDGHERRRTPSRRKARA